MGGLDCGATAQVLLMAGGADPPGDQTAQGLYDHFSKPENQAFPITSPQLGALIFYGTSHVYHVAVALDGLRMIEAAGGGPTTRDLADAIKHGAWVKIRPIRTRDRVGMFMPKYIDLDVKNN
jgi:cell wall-associated NlpC family hydrolase